MSSRTLGYGTSTSYSAANHAIVVSHQSLTGPSAQNVVYTDGNVTGISGLYNKVLGTVVGPGTGVDHLAQGDFLFSAADIANGIFQCTRALPPGAPQVIRQGETILYTDSENGDLIPLTA